MSQITARWLLGRTDLGIVPAGGEAGLDVPISLAMTTELPDPGRWLSGGELVLTTGLALDPSPEGLRRYLRGLAESGVAAVGLGLGVGLTWQEVPPGVRPAADEVGLAVVVVPLEIPFAAVIREVMGALAELEYQAQMRASRAQPRMTRAAVEGGAAAIVRELAVAIDGAAVCCDTAGAVVGAYPGLVEPELLAEVADVAAHVGRGPMSVVSATSTGRTVTTQTIRVGPALHGLLAVATAVPLSASDQVLLGHANSLLALGYERPRRLTEATERVAAICLRHALAGDDEAIAELADTADAGGFVRVLAVADGGAGRAGAGAVRDALAARRRPLVAMGDGSVLLAVLPADVAAGVGAEVADACPNAHIGLSAPHEVAAVGRAAAQARLAARTASRGVAPEEFAAVATHALLADPTIAGALRGVVAPLTSHDAARGTDLVGALRAYLDANGNADQAAVAVGVHRHTLRSRVDRAAGILCVDLGSALVRAELLLALLAADGD